MIPLGAEMTGLMGAAGASAGGGVVPITNTYSLAFDGSDEYVDIGNVLNFDLDDPFTFSIWMKTSFDYPNYMLPFAKSDGGGNDGYYCYLNYPNGYISFFLANVYSGGTNIIGVKLLKGDLTDDNWHHFAVTYDGSKFASGMSMYIDGSAGSLVTMYDSLTGSTINSDNLLIGARNGTAYDWKGNLDEFAIYDVELNAANIAAIYNSGTPMDLNENGGNYSGSADLVGWWRMGDGGTWGGSNWDIPDVSTNSNDGTSANMLENDRVEEVPS